MKIEIDLAGTGPQRGNPRLKDVQDAIYDVQESANYESPLETSTAELILPILEQIQRELL